MDRKQLNKILLRDYKVDWKKPEDVAIFLVRVRNVIFMVLAGFALLQLLELGNFYPIIAILLILGMVCEFLRFWKGKKKFAIVSLILIIYCVVLAVIMFFFI